MRRARAVVMGLGLGVAACAPGASGSSGPTAAAEPSEGGSASAGGEAVAEQTSVYWGDTHLHTTYSPDAYMFRNASADPDVAYRYAKGFPVVHPYHRARVQIGTPLDFLVVADHGEAMGLFPQLFGGNQAMARTPSGRLLLRLVQQGKNTEVFERFIAAVNDNRHPFPDLDTEEIRRSVWEGYVAITERHNDPGRFTSFIGWEWTSTPNGANLHRVVFTPQGGDVAARFTPFTSFDSDRPEDLWRWLDETSQRAGAQFVAIPHNPNIGGGRMFATTDSDGRPITADYARTRMTWEPVVEMTQIKGDSETSARLSPNDEFAEFETYTHVLDMSAGTREDVLAPDADPANYVRSALLRGLQLGADVGVNPYQFGFIGATDSHSGLASAEEDNFHGKFALDSVPEQKWDEVSLGVSGKDMSAGGLAAVWARENTRTAIFEAFRRREVYASTGPRIRLRFFGGWDFTAEDAAAPDHAERGYTRGVPMGGDLTAASDGRAPSFLVVAVKDPVRGNLDRIQIVKGWLGADGETHERVFDVALSDGRAPGPDGRVPPVGNTVDLRTGAFTNSIGDAMLSAAWTDPEFDPAQRAFYYVRVLEIPTPRHTTLDAIALGRALPEGLPATIQERAYSSPIWYTP